jgi:hypothetical protein
MLAKPVEASMNEDAREQFMLVFGQHCDWKRLARIELASMSYVEVHVNDESCLSVD